MANVVEVIPVPPASGGSEVETGGTYVLRYLVQFDAVHADHTLAITATDGTNAVPSYGTAHPSDSSAVVVEKQATPDEESPDWWMVTVTFKVPKSNPEPPESPNPPSQTQNTSPPVAIQNQRVLIKWYRKPVAADTDVAGDDILNSAGEPYDPPAQKEELYPEFTFIRTQATFNLDWMHELRNARNNAPVTIGNRTFVTHELRIMDIGAEWPIGQDGNGWQVTIVVRYDPLEQHDLVLLDAGWSYLNDAETALIPFVDAPLGVGSKTLTRLNGEGKRLPFGDPSVYNSYQVCPNADFSALALDWPL